MSERIWVGQIRTLTEDSRTAPGDIGNASEDSRISVQGNCIFVLSVQDTLGIRILSLGTHILSLDTHMIVLSVQDTLGIFAVEDNLAVGNLVELGLSSLNELK